MFRGGGQQRVSFMRLQPSPAARPSRALQPAQAGTGLSWQTRLACGTSPMEGAGPEAPPWLPRRPHS